MLLKRRNNSEYRAVITKHHPLVLLHQNGRSVRSVCLLYYKTVAFVGDAFVADVKPSKAELSSVRVSAAAASFTLDPNLLVSFFIHLILK